MGRNTKALLPALITIIYACGGSHCLAQEQNPDLAKAHWIWTSPAPTAIGEWECYARKTFDLTGEATSAAVLITADNVYELYVNGKKIAADGHWATTETIDLTRSLKTGENVVAIRGHNYLFPATTVQLPALCAETRCSY